MTLYLDNAEIAHLRAWRHKLHQYPEISGEEMGTAREVVSFLADTNPDHVITGLGGHGVALVYNGADPGPTVLLRCELDALQIHEVSDLPYRSRIDGKAHMCGHDGHMAGMGAVARYIGKHRPLRGRAVLLFQPAEETAHGAEAVLADPKFAEVTPDYAFAIHNMPGLPLAHVAVAPGQITCASMGLRIELSGKTAHASMPETGVSPARAVALIIQALEQFQVGELIAPGFRRVTLTQVNMGKPVFGVTPGSAELRMTLRTPQSEAIHALLDDVLRAVGEIADREGLGFHHSTHNFFRACINDPEAAHAFEVASERMKLSRVTTYVPIRGAEDFGMFGSCSKSALLFIGSGMDRPMVHNPDYDFPDELIPVEAGLFLGVLDQFLGVSQKSGA
ncbi:amidohydrolase [Rhizobium sp. RM]|uniref:amidohydrolase n=1 Tax=Rhizobium sp. RM TaxID=2748079 RepID=UPI00110D8E15|nr:amidohydrolase [Rhizobium sp. RM]NWJ25342.1 amidohydrolase [Rhizobium sp. RM]TMV17571.1 amidohydrolase [Rhizobium sp. Td3]